MNRAGHLVLILSVLVLQALAINVEFQVDHRLIVLLFGVFKVLGASTQLLVQYATYGAVRAVLPRVRFLLRLLTELATAVAKDLLRWVLRLLLVLRCDVTARALLLLLSLL